MDGKVPCSRELCRGLTTPELGFYDKSWACRGRATVLGSSTPNGEESFGLEKRLMVMVSSHAAGVHRSLQAPGARGPPGEAGNGSHGHREDHLGLLDKVTAGTGHKGGCRPGSASKCVCGWDLKKLRDRATLSLGSGGRRLLVPVWATGFDPTRALKCKVLLFV